MPASTFLQWPTAAFIPSCLCHPRHLLVKNEQNREDTSQHCVQNVSQLLEKRGGSNDTEELIPTVWNLLNCREHPIVCRFVQVNLSTADVYSLMAFPQFFDRVIITGILEDDVGLQMKNPRSKQCQRLAENTCIWVKPGSAASWSDSLPHLFLKDSG